MMYGPGNVDENLFKNIDGNIASEDPGSLATNIDVPIVLDRFFAANDRSIWWHRPEYPVDRLWRNVGGQMDSSVDHDDRPYTDEHYTPVHGELQASHRSMFWLSPTNTVGYLTHFANGTLQEIGIDKAICGLADNVQYNAVPGDYSNRRLVIVGSCSTKPTSEATDDGDDPQYGLCVQVCLKPFCDPTLEPTEDVEQECMSSCMTQLDEANEYSCSDIHEDLIACLDELSCDEYYQWSERSPGAACAEEEQKLSNACPEVTIRDAGG